MDSNVNIDGVISNAMKACEILGLRRGMAYAMTPDHIMYIIPELVAVAKELKKQLDHKEAAIDDLARGLYAKKELIEKLEDELDKFKIDAGKDTTEEGKLVRRLENRVQSIEDWQRLHLVKTHEIIDTRLDAIETQKKY